MIPKVIHLIWLGTLQPIAQEAVEHWKKMGSGREVILHTSSEALVPELQSIWNYVENHNRCNVLRSDLLRWSILLTAGGWYFDCDIRTNLSLDIVEENAKATNRQLIIRSLSGSKMQLLSNVVGCPIYWPGKEHVLQYLASSIQLPLGELTMRWFPPWDLPWQCDNQTYFAILPPKKYSILRCVLDRPVLYIPYKGHRNPLP